VVSSTPRPHFTSGKDPVPILQEAGWAPGPAWTAGKSRPHRDSTPDRPARSQSLYRLSYPAHTFIVLGNNKGKGKVSPRTGHEGLEGECRYSSILSLTSSVAWGA